MSYIFHRRRRRHHHRVVRVNRCAGVGDGRITRDQPRPHYQWGGRRHSTIWGDSTTSMWTPFVVKLGWKMEDPLHCLSVSVAVVQC